MSGSPLAAEGALLLRLAGAGEASHDFVTGRRGSFRELVQGAARAAAQRRSIELVVLVTRPLVPELRSVASLALGLGAGSVVFAWPSAADQPWRVPRYELAAPDLLVAAAALQRRRRTVAFAGLPRCLLPVTAALVVAPVDDDGAAAPTYAPRCAGCSRRPDCAGIPGDYLARFGDRELRPLAAPSAGAAPTAASPGNGSAAAPPRRPIAG